MPYDNIRSSMHSKYTPLFYSQIYFMCSHRFFFLPPKWIWSPANVKCNRDNRVKCKTFKGFIYLLRVVNMSEMGWGGGVCVCVCVRHWRLFMLLQAVLIIFWQAWLILANNRKPWKSSHAQKSAYYLDISQQAEKMLLGEGTLCRHIKLTDCRIKAQITFRCLSEIKRTTTTKNSHQGYGVGGR